MADDSGVMVVAETRGSGLAPSTLELLALGSDVARQLGQPLYAALIGSEVSSSAEDLATVAERVYLLDHPSLAEFDLDRQGEALAMAVETAQPTTVLLGASPQARDLAAQLAARLNTGVVTNCLALHPNAATGSLEAVCSVFGGTAQATYQFDDTTPRIVAVQPGVSEPMQLPQGGRGEVIPLSAGPAATPRTRIVKPAAATGPKLEDADVIVAGGKGLGEADNFRYVVELAEALDGLPAASRAIVDLGWATPDQQVGLTGKVVTPSLYVAVGISGASQHMAGCSAARNIVAINRDPDAAIFRYARYGVVADSLEFLPHFIEQCLELRGERPQNP